MWDTAMTMEPSWHVLAMFEPRQRQEELESHFSKLASDFRELKAASGQSETVDLRKP